MDEPADERSSESDSDDPDDTQTKKGRYLTSSIINEGIIAGQKIAKISVATLISVGIAELIVGYISGSVVATADGIDSMSDAMISFIVLIGLRIARRPPDTKFHFGYHKVETLAAMLAAVGMIIIGSIIIYHSYDSFIHPQDIKHPLPTMIVLAAASAISLYRAFQMRIIANKYQILSLKTDAKNSIKDGTGSVIGFFSILIATQFGFLKADAIGGMIIAGYIFSVAYVSLRQSSLILIDAWQSPKMTELVKRIIEEKFGYEQIGIRSVLLRSAGMITQAEVHVEVDGNKPLKDIELLSAEIQIAIRSEIPTMERISIIPHSFSEKPETRRARLFRSRNRNRGS
ncbi:MAG TPA: cation diffusion facilitator family transporter [Nitrososphaeraceae archaeon]|nr:cation diffusion facilitator family transporter [Nitrososphaeraceae archaeon]